MYRWASLAPAIGSGSAVAWSKDVKRIRKRQANASEAKGKGERKKMANIEQQRGKAGTPIWDWQDKGKGDMHEGNHKEKVLLEDPHKVTSWLITKTSQKIRFNSWLLDLMGVDSSIACVSLCLMSHFNPKNNMKYIMKTEWNRMKKRDDSWNVKIRQSCDTWSQLESTDRCTLKSKHVRSQRLERSGSLTMATCRTCDPNFGDRETPSRSSTVMSPWSEFWTSNRIV